jgi:hypothetical protein
MRKLLLGLALAFGAGSLLAQPTPPVPPVAPPAAAATTEYFPLKEGSTWVYKVGESEVTVKVGATDKGETKLETLANGKPVASESVTVKADGVYRTKINATAIEPPVKILELETKDGSESEGRQVDRGEQSADADGRRGFFDRRSGESEGRG